MCQIKKPPGCRPLSVNSTAQAKTLIVFATRKAWPSLSHLNQSIRTSLMCLLKEFFFDSVMRKVVKFGQFWEL